MSVPPLPTDFDSIPAAFSHVGITSDADTSAGQIGGTGGSYSAEALAAVGYQPAQPYTTNGITFQVPSFTPGKPNDVPANGQTIKFSGQGSKLSFLVNSSYSPPQRYGTVRYLDGSVQPFQLATADWYNGPPAGTTTGVSTPYRNTTSGKDNHTVRMFLSSVTLDPTRRIASITLPDIGDGTTPRVGSTLVFATALTD